MSAATLAGSWAGALVPALFGALYARAAWRWRSSDRKAAE